MAFTRGFKRDVVPMGKGKKRVREAVPVVGRSACGAYEAWLRERGVRWDDAVSITTEGVAAGWGCVATRSIKKGAKLFQVPASACFGARSRKPDTDPDGKDSQQRLAIALLAERDKGTSSAWAPMLSMLSAAPGCPWRWPAEAQRYLDGTELEPVLRLKRVRLEAESRSLGLEADTYESACALVASEANPWFGGSIVPFNWTLNYAPRPNVSFESEGARAARRDQPFSRLLAPDVRIRRVAMRAGILVVGRAARAVHAGEELTQEYAEATTDLIYRYGFAPSAGRAAGLDGDVVSISLDLVAGVMAQADGGTTAPEERASVLCATGALAPSPWDGLESTLTVELGNGGEGSAKLVGLALGLAAPTSEWEAVSRRVKDAGDDDDLAAAELVAGLCGAEAAAAESLRRLARAEGGEDGDPWPALIAAAPRCATLAAARVVASRALSGRRALLEEAPTLATPPPASGPLAAPWAMASHLRRIELAILVDAERSLAAGVAYSE